MKWTQEELYVYDYWSGKEGDRKAQITTAENKGIAKGEAKGKEERYAVGIREKGFSGLSSFTTYPANQSQDAIP